MDVNGMTSDGMNKIEMFIDPDYRIKYDGYCIDVTENSIKIFSKESRGVLYGVYTLLEKLGCCWFYPVEKEQIIPCKPDLVMNTGRYTEEPVIEHRGLCLYGVYEKNLELTISVLDWMAKNRYNLLMTSIERPAFNFGSHHNAIYWKDVERELNTEVGKRGFILDMSEHSTEYFFPRSLFEEHPEWFSLIDGRRQPRQICYSNQEALEYYAREQIRYAREHPEIDILGTWPLDGGGYCECDKCKDPETILRSIAYIANRIKEAGLNIIVEHLAYKPQSYAPPNKVNIPDNLSVLMCDRTDEIARKWAERANKKGGSYYFEYYTGDNYRWKANLWIDPYYPKKMVETSLNVGFTGVISLYLPIDTWWRAGINYYMLGKSYWDINIDINDELEKYFKLYYRDQSDTVMKAFDIILSQMQDKELWITRPFGRKGCKDKHTCEQKRKFYAAVEIIKELLDISKKQSEDKNVKVNIERICCYVKYLEYYYTMVDENIRKGTGKINIQDMLQYVESLPDELSPVIVDFKYILWRLQGENPEFAPGNN